MRPNPTVVKRKLHEIFVIEPNDLGIHFITSVYKRITGHLKTMPFIFIIPACLIAALLASLIFGHLAVRLVTLLQYGF